jgi:hypothetical protein
VVIKDYFLQLGLYTVDREKQEKGKAAELSRVVPGKLKSQQ